MKKTLIPAALASLVFACAFAAHAQDTAGPVTTELPPPTLR